jgi:hypothetical protein
MNDKKLEASFSTLTLSIASTAIMGMGYAPNPTTGKTEKDLKMARFNIDLLVLLKEKTKNNLTDEENRFLTNAINDLQLKFVQAK